MSVDRVVVSSEELDQIKPAPDAPLSFVPRLPPPVPWWSRLLLSPLVLVLPVLFGDALGNWGKEVAQFLPSHAGASFSTSIPDGPYSLSPWVGLLVLAGWVAVALAIAAGVLRRRDA